MRRLAIRWGVAVFVAGLLAVGPAVAAEASAFGAVAAPTGTTVSADSSRAILSWDGTTETIDLAIALESSTGTVGFVFPTPSKATVGRGDRSLFDLVETQTAPIEQVEDDWWGRSTPPSAPVSDIARAPIGDIAPETIRATSRSGLTNWLRKHRLHLTEAERDQIAGYAADGWSLTMIALDGAAPVDGELDPIRLSFRTKKFIVPMRLAAAGTAANDLRLFVLGDHRTEFRQAGSSTRNVNAAQSLVWAGTVTAPTLTERGSYLTVTDLRFDKPDKQVAGDIAIVEAPADDELVPSVVVFTPVSLLGFPLGWLLVVWGGIGVLLGVGYLLNRFRTR